MSVPLKFSFNRDVLAGPGELALQVNAADSALQKALIKNTGLPRPAAPLILGSASVGVEPGKALALGTNSMTVGTSCRPTRRVTAEAHQ